MVTWNRSMRAKQGAEQAQTLGTNLNNTPIPSIKAVIT
jgi:hypothetical protein